MRKQELAQKRNYFKFVLFGMYKPIDRNVLTEEERELFDKIFELRQILLDNFDDNSRKIGLNVPEHKCFCGKPAKHFIEHYGWVCNKHYKEYYDRH